MYQEKGSGYRINHQDISTARKKVVAATIDAEKRSRVGSEIEKSIFLERYKDFPDVVKRAKYFPVRVKDEHGRWVTEMHTKVYDDVRGVYRFEESQSKETKSSQVVDDMEFEFGEGHQQQVFEDTAAATSRASTASQRVTLADVGGSLPSSSSVNPPQSRQVEPAESRGEKRKKEVVDLEESDDDDEMTPMDKALGRIVMGEQPQGKPKAKAKAGAGKAVCAQAKAKAGAGQGAGTGAFSAGGGAHGKADDVTQQLINEVDAALSSLKSRKILDQGIVESLSSLSSRLQSRRTALGKHASRDKSGTALNSINVVSGLRAKVQGLLDSVKSSIAYNTKPTRKNCISALERWRELAICGVTQDMLPTCMSSSPAAAEAMILCFDRKWKEVAPLLKAEALKGRFMPEADAEDVEQSQRKIATAALLDVARAQFEAKEQVAVAAVRVQQHCAEYSAQLEGSETQKFVKAAAVVLNDSVHSAVEVCEAPCLEHACVVFVCHDVWSFRLNVYFAVHEALDVVDAERHYFDNDFCKFIVNVGPFDQLLTSVRSRALTNTKRKDFEERLRAFQDNQHVVDLKKADELDMPQAVSLLLAVADDYEVFCRDMPTGNEYKTDSLVASLKEHFQSMATLWSPLCAKSKLIVKGFSKKMFELLQDTATSGPDREAWKQMIAEGTGSVYRPALHKCIDLVTAACEHSGIDKPEVLQQQQSHLRAASAVTGLATSVADLCAPANPPISPQSIGEACKMMVIFEKTFGDTGNTGDEVSLQMFLHCHVIVFMLSFHCTLFSICFAFLFFRLLIAWMRT